MVKNSPAVMVLGFDPCIGKITWRRKFQPMPVFLSGKPHGPRSLVATEHGVADSWAQLRDYTTVIYSLTDAALLSLIVWVIMEPKQ